MKGRLAALGALVTASLASICCLGPLLLVGAGLGGAGIAASLARNRPLFLLLTATFLAFAFYWTYRKYPVSYADGICKSRTESRSMKLALWVVSLLVLGIATYPYWVAFLRDCCVQPH